MLRRGTITQAVYDANAARSFHSRRTYSKGVSENRYRIPLIIGLAPQVVSILVLFFIPERCVMRSCMENAHFARN